MLVPNKRLKLLILYSEVMPYVVSIWEILIREYNTEVVLVQWDTKKLTPYSLDDSAVKSFDRSRTPLGEMKKIYQKFNPDVLYVSGRMDPDYLTIAKMAKSHGKKVVMGSDKQWRGTIKDYMATAVRHLLYHRFFTHIWVPGRPQAEFARRVGFNPNNIVLGLYAGNVDLFSAIYQTRVKNKLILNDILFVGRLHEVKGILPLITILKRLKDRNIFHGRFWIYGNGPLDHEIPKYSWIIKKGFAGQSEIAEGILSSRFFCLPSLREPWGVVIHEMAAAGMPILCSDACGAASEFVEIGKNGFTFKAGNWPELEKSLVAMLSVPFEEILTMGRHSHKLGHNITPSSSAQNLLSIL